MCSLISESFPRAFHPLHSIFPLYLSRSILALSGESSQHLQFTSLLTVSKHFQFDPEYSLDKSEKIAPQDLSFSLQWDKTLSLSLFLISAVYLNKFKQEISVKIRKIAVTKKLYVLAKTHKARTCWCDTLTLSAQNYFHALKINQKKDEKKTLIKKIIFKHRSVLNKWE